MLEVQGLKAGYGLSQVLFDMHLSIEQGQVVSLKGGVMHTFKNTGTVTATIVEVFGKAPKPPQ